MIASPSVKIDTSFVGCGGLNDAIGIIDHYRARVQYSS